MKKPPLGIKPRWLHRAERAEDILQAIWRYSVDEKPIPPHWIIELNDLLSEEWPSYATVKKRKEKNEE